MDGGVKNGKGDGLVLNIDLARRAPCKAKAKGSRFHFRFNAYSLCRGFLCSSVASPELG